MPKLRDLDVRFVSLVDRAAVRQAEHPSEPQRFLMWKADKGEPMPETMTPEETQAALQKAEQERDSALEAQQKAEGERDTATAQVAELEKAAKKPAEGEDEPDADDVLKGELPPAVRDRIEKAESEAAATRQRLEKAEEMAKAERDERLTRDFVAKAEGYRALVVKSDEFGPLLKRVADTVSKEDFEALETVLSAADEQIAKGELFKEQGAGGEGQRSGAYEEAMQKVEELRKSDSTISQANALDQVFKADKALEARYLAENR